MGKIFYIMGKSSSGKDTIYRKLLEKEELDLKKVVLYTTRPVRMGEANGREYFFVDEAAYESFCSEGKVIEARAYDTIHGIWRYFTAADGQICLEGQDYLMIGTLEAYEKMRAYFGEETMIPIYIELEDGMRLQRALDRERAQDTPKYAEMCRRFLADSGDFSEAHIKEAGIERRFVNEDLDQCIREILAYMEEKKEL